MSNTNCLKCVPKLPITFSKRLNVLDKCLDQRVLKMKKIIKQDIKNDDEILIFERNGSCHIQTLFFECEASDENNIFNSQFIFYIDDEKEPSIKGKIKNLFLSSEEGKEVYSDYYGKTVSGNQVSFYRYLFIPFYKSCKIYIRSQEKIFNLKLQVYYYEDENRVDFGRYGKAYDLETSGKEHKQGESVELMHVKGKGLIHSINFTMENDLSPGIFMEGNFEIYIDGNSFPMYQSTGTEEFFMGGVYFMNLHESTYTGCARSFNDGSENKRHLSSAHRLFIEDPIVFDREIRIVWHNGEIGQGEEYKGTTHYDFHALYYLEINDYLNTKELSLKEANQRIQTIDGNAIDMHLIFQEIEKREIKKGRKTIVNLQKSGCLTHLYLEAIETSKIGFVVDGKDLGAIPLSLFFLAGDDKEYHVGDKAGRTGLNAFYKYLSIPFNEALEIYLESESQFNLVGKLEYRDGKTTGSSTYSHKVIKKQKNESFVSIINEGKGELESFVMHLKSKEKMKGEISIYIDQEKIPNIKTDLSSFFLTGFQFSGRKGYSKQVGVIKNEADEVIAFRFFIEDKITFKNKVKIVIEGKYLTIDGYFTYFLKDENRLDKKPTITNLYQRLNRLDHATESNLFYCYNAFEDHQGMIGPNETRVLFEDFGFGAITCIRLGTPFTGKVLSNALFKIYLDGEKTPVVETTVARFFSAFFDETVYFSGSRKLSRISKLDSDKIGEGHTSLFRYILIPYKKGIKITLSATEDGPLNGFMNVYYQKGKDAPTDYGRYSCINDQTFDGKLYNDDKVLMADVKGKGLLDSIQINLKNPHTDDFLDNEIIFEVDKNIVFKTKVFSLFFAPKKIDDNTYYLTYYSDKWEEKRKEENGGFTFSKVGWTKRRNKAPYEVSVYRLFEDNPIIFNKMIKVYMKSNARNTTQLQSDLIFYTET